jgi:hypothetical protein|tara:strand:+ start:1914 stop:2573 length:660 start_codon:yes stop_codon:yes gene_type:complete
MAGTLKVGGVTLATHSDSTGLASLDSSVTGSPNIDVITNTGSGFRPAEVWLSTTQISGSNTFVTLPTGYKKYRLSGSDIHFIGSLGAYGYVDIYFRYNSTDDINVQCGYRLRRLDTSGGGDGNLDGILRCADNQGTDSPDNCTFEIIMDSLTISGRSRGYRILYNSSYGHATDQHSYAILGGGYSQSTSVIDEIRVFLHANNGSFTGYGGELVLTGFTR